MPLTFQPRGRQVPYLSEFKHNDGLTHPHSTGYGPRQSLPSLISSSSVFSIFFVPFVQLSSSFIIIMETIICLHHQFGNNHLLSSSSWKLSSTFIIILATIIVLHHHLGTINYHQLRPSYGSSNQLIGSQIRLGLGYRRFDIFWRTIGLSPNAWRLVIGYLIALRPSHWLIALNIMRPTTGWLNF